MRNIPEGYTYKRCDQYTKEEFLKLYINPGCKNPSKDALKYVTENPKEVYNTDDIIAVHQLKNPVGSLQGGTTKRYGRLDDARFELRPNDTNRKDPLLEVKRRYDYYLRRELSNR